MEYQFLDIGALVTVFTQVMLNMTHAFTKPGLYDITLTVANEAGNSTVTEKSYITVTSPKTPVAYFSANVTSGTAPLTVLFAATRHQTLLYTDIITGGVPTPGIGISAILPIQSMP